MLPSVHNLEGVKGQWLRVKRWQKRLLSIKSNPEMEWEDKWDFIFAFFQNCYHLKDWISYQHQKNPTILKSLNELMNNEEMKICRDICNGTKHLDISRPSLDENFYMCREYNYFDNDEDYVVHSSNKKDKVLRYEIIDLSYRCLNLWEDFFRETKIESEALWS